MLRFFAISDTAGSAADFMVKMSVKHPVAFYLWYRWWIPLLVSVEERKKIPREFCLRSSSEYGGAYWRDFALCHPFLVLWVLLFQSVIQYLTTSVKMLVWRVKSPVAKDTFNDILLDEKFVKQDSDVPQN